MPRTVHICEICNQEYSTKESAERCERDHIGKGSILTVFDSSYLDYRHAKDRTSRWPSTLILILDNGEGAKYEKVIDHMIPADMAQACLAAAHK